MSCSMLIICVFFHCLIQLSFWAVGKVLWTGHIIWLKNIIFSRNLNLFIYEIINLFHVLFLNPRHKKRDFISLIPQSVRGSSQTDGPILMQILRMLIDAPVFFSYRTLKWQCRGLFNFSKLGFALNAFCFLGKNKKSNNINSKET